MVRLAFTGTSTKNFSASLLTLLSIFSTGCANSCISGFWNPPNGTIGIVAGNPPPACSIATPKAAIHVVVQVSDFCESCSGSNRVGTVVLNLRGIDFHASTSAAGESSRWQPLLSEPGKHSIQVEFLSERMNALFSESPDGLPIPAGGYDLVRLRLARNQPRVEGKSLAGNVCGEEGPNCVIMGDGHVAHLGFEADALEFHLTSEATVGGFPFIIPNSESELLIELKPALSIAPPLREATGSFVILPGRARMEPRR